MKINRLLGITIYLLGKQKVPASELADRFEVSLRTIYRDIDTINSAGIPIVSFSGKEGGYAILDTFKLDKRLLSFDDMLSILTALKGFNTTFRDKSLDSAMEKISSLLPKDKDSEARRRLEQVIFDIEPWGSPKTENEKMQTLHQAINTKHVVKIQYKTIDKEENSRSIEPLSLVFKGYAWYLLAYCRVREDFRIFRLSRIKSLEITNQTFVAKDFSYDGFFAKQADKSVYRQIVLKFSPNVKERVEEYYPRVY